MWSKRCHYQIIVCALVLIFVNIPETWTQYNDVPQSPCPDVFVYRSDGFEYSGWGQLTNLPRGEDIVMMAKLIVGAQLPRNYYGKLQLVGAPEQIVNDIYTNQPVNFKIEFPIQNPLPLISSITVNDRVICQSSSYTPQYGYTTKVTLQYMFKPVVPHNYRPTFIQKPADPFFQASNNNQNNNNGFPLIGNDFDQEIYPQNPNNGINNNNHQIFVIPNGGNSNPNEFPGGNFPTQRPARPQRPQTNPTQFYQTTTQIVPTRRPAPADNFNIGCGKIPQSFTGLAFGGTTIDKGEWPWLVAIHNYASNAFSFRCAGTIISRSSILSAAHCFYLRKTKIRAEDITIFLGHHNIKQLLEEGSRIINVNSIAVHPDYKPDGRFYSDIAIAKFVEVVEFSEFIQPVCLWTGSPDISQVVGQVGSLVGWGRDENGNLFTPEPKKVQVPIVTDEMCLRSHEAFAKITNERTFCGGWRNGTDGPCTGDSGTGLMMNRGGIWYIRGVVSSSVTDPSTATCNLYEYVVFTDVAKFTGWIQSNM